MVQDREAFKHAAKALSALVATALAADERDLAAVVTETVQAWLTEAQP